MLNYLLQDEPPEGDKPAGAEAEAPRAPLPGWCTRSREWWNSGPVVAWVAYLLPGAAADPLACPRCGREGTLQSNLDHLLGNHGAGYSEAADWLEAADPDLYALAIHYLAGKARGVSARE